MAVNMEDWTIDANEAVTLSIYSPKTGKELTSPFHPTWTYPIFGEEQTIFGYKDLKIRILFAADDMKPCVEITWAERFKKVGDVEAEDVKTLLEEFLPAEAFSINPPAFLRSITSRTEPFTPPGTLTSSFPHPSEPSSTIAIHHSTLSDPRTRALLANMQILVSLYIEGATPLDLDDEDWVLSRWEVFTLYSISPEKEHTFLGYCTLYRHYFFHPSDSNLGRIRLSQILVLPPWHNQGLGRLFYDEIVKYYMNIPEIVELTVEDPSEVFDDMRTIADLARVRRDPEFANLTLDKALSSATKPKSKSKSAFSESPPNLLEMIRKRHKLPPRPFSRLLELHFLSTLDKKQKRAYKQYRLFVKKRVYKQNADVLMQLDKGERREKLETTYQGLEEDYERLLKRGKARKVEDYENEEGGEGSVDEKEEGRRKRVRRE